VQIRAYVDDDWAQVWPIISEVVTAGETYVYDPAWPEHVLKDVWVEQAPAHTVVAVDEDGTVLGTAKMGPNRPGPGSHVATGSYMVATSDRGIGVGRALCGYSIDWARASGFHGMQFNAVVAANRAAVHLWQQLGFEIVGTVPEAFRHPTEGLVALHVMYRRL
jgi:L-amino acid N-acyltransferase YncA